jgi:hypothetical protein
VFQRKNPILDYEPRGDPVERVPWLPLATVMICQALYIIVAYTRIDDDSIRFLIPWVVPVALNAFFLRRHLSPLLLILASIVLSVPGYFAGMLYCVNTYGS